MRKHQSKRLISLLLALVLCLGLAVPVSAADTGSSGVQIEKVDNSAVSVSTLDDSKQANLDEEETPLYQDTDMVRVSIVLEGKSTLEKGFSTRSIAENSKAVAYRDSLQAQQETVTQKISRSVLGGKSLDVVWNLTLAANIISANVPYGDIEAIKAVPGVEDVVLETRYEPQVVSVDAADPNMATSGSMIGSSTAYLEGYYGAGSRIAVIDTGTDTDHQSFNAAAFDYAVAEDAAKAGKTVADYDLLDAAEIAEKLPQLNISGKNDKWSVSADEASQLYLNSKLAFTYNYIDKSFDVTHDGDSQGEHGSHVAGIATANRYIANGDGTFSDALDAAHTQGVAPDAQLITMKVFGKGGGAYDSDYMAAIEDAIVLGADAINLSLGSGNPGMSSSGDEVYETILDNLTKSDTVVSISSGNSSYWAENANNGTGYLYGDDVNFQTDGNPGSFTNALTVASVDNVGSTGNYLAFGENKVFFSETSGYSNPTITTLDKSADGSGTEYDFVLFENTGVDGSGNSLLTGYADVLKGKVVMVYRGTSSFYEKHDAVGAVGGAACIVVNNQPGVINMDLSSSTAEIPCVSITQADGAAVKAAATAVKAEDGTVLYYTGKVTVSNKIGSAVQESDHYTMSSFSSWGVPGSLELKPEITAPGGNIYSVNGAVKGGTAYENMSGTSMAAPQVAGMAALVAQYIRENGLAAKTGLTARALSQSLLMSTATPVTDEYGLYNSVLQQGAGLANVADAIHADSYILMDANANAGAKDGKVKVELGDDPARTGSYETGFTLYNLTDKAAGYNLSADIFTQDMFAYRGSTYLDTVTTPLAAEVSWSVNGKTLDKTVSDLGDVNGDGAANTDDAQAILDYVAGNTVEPFNASAADMDGNGEITSYDAHLYLAALNSADVTLPAGGSVEIKVSFRLSADSKEYLDAYYTSGAYVEGYLNVTEASTQEGSEGTSHSIPVLGFYGDWSDASMYDVGSYLEYSYGLESRPNYIGTTRGNSPVIRYAGDSGAYYFGGNPYVKDAQYLPERTAFNSENGDTLYGQYFTGIRNAGEGIIQVTNAETGEVYDRQTVEGPVYSAYYYSNGSSWRNTQSLAHLGWTGKDASGNALPEGTKVNVSLVLAPEYYANADGSYDWDSLTGGVLGEGAYLTTTLTIDNTAPEMVAEPELNGKTLSVKVKDNQYVAAVLMVTADGQTLVAVNTPNQTEAGKETEVTLDLGDALGNNFLLQVLDYAGNASTYRFTQALRPDIDAAYTGYNRGTGVQKWESYNADGSSHATAGYGGLNLFCGAYAGGYVFAYDFDNNFYVMDAGDLSTRTLIKSGESYGNEYMMLGDMAYDQTTGKMYLTYWKNWLWDTNFTLAEINLQTGELTDVSEQDAIPVYTLAVDGSGNFYGYGYYDGKLYTFTLDTLTEPKQLESDEVTIGMPSDLTWDSANQQLLLAANTYEDDGSTPITSCLYSVDPATGAATKKFDTAGPLVALYTKADESQPALPGAANATGLTLSTGSISMLAGSTAKLSAALSPWNLADKSVSWTSSDPTVAAVDENGVVSGLSKGSATITAVSNATPSVSASCEVEVTTLAYTLRGALQDEDGNTQLFTWDLENSKTWTKTSDLEAKSIESMTMDTQNNALYLMDDVENTWSVHKVDPATGKDIESYDSTLGLPLWDMEYSSVFSTKDQPLINAVYYLYFLPGKDPAALSDSAFDLQSALSQMGADYLTAITTLGETTVTDDDGVSHQAEMTLALDNAGNIWSVEMYQTESGYSAGLNVYETNLADLGLSFDGYDNGMYCSLVTDSDGVNLFLSYFTGEANQIYMLSAGLDEEYNLTFQATLIGDVGENVWPAALYAASSNEASNSSGLVNVLHSAKAAETTTLETEKVDFDAFQTAKQVVTGSLNAVTAASAGAAGVEKTAVSAAAAGETAEVKLALDAKNATNGKLTVSYDPAVLRVSSVNGVGSTLVGYADDGNGKLTVAYAAAESILGNAAVVTFAYDPSSCPENTTVTISSLEVNDGTEEQSEMLALKLRDAEPVTPVNPVPSTPTTPTEPTAPELPFKDVPTGHPFYDDIKYVYEKGLMQGASADLFASGATTTRAMIVTILYRMEGEPAVSGTASFKDVADGMYYSKAVAWAAANGIVKGYSDGTFQPDQTIIREQMAAILYRYAQYKGYDVSVGENTNILSYTDVSQVSEYAIPAFQWAVGAGIINGTSASTLSPKGSATRGQVAAILHRYCEQIG